jgi:hypothetical protein
MVLILLSLISSCAWVDRLRIKEVIITNECGWYKIVPDIKDNLTVDYNNLMYEELCLIKN